MLPHSPSRCDRFGLASKHRSPFQHVDRPHTHTHISSLIPASAVDSSGGGSFSCLFSLDLFCTSFPHQSGFARARRIGTATREKTYMYMYIPVDLVNMNNSHAYQNLCLRSHDSTRGERKERAHTHTHTYLYL